MQRTPSREPKKWKPRLQFYKHKNEAAQLPKIKKEAAIGRMNITNGGAKIIVE